MTNVVLVRHEADYGFGNYLFETPVDLKKGQRVRVKTRRGESDAIVMHDRRKCACHDGDCLSCEPAACACDWRVFVHSGGQRRKKCVRRKTSERSI